MTMYDSRAPKGHSWRKAIHVSALVNDTVFVNTHLESGSDCWETVNVNARVRINVHDLVLAITGGQASLHIVSIETVETST